jgi:hypothetical protein
VYADFLDETGDPNDAARAELIRIQIAAARLFATDPTQWRELHQLAEDIRTRHQASWFPGVDPKRLASLHRGFNSHWSCSSPAHYAGAAPFASEPINSLSLHVTHAGELAIAGNWPELARIKKLGVWAKEGVGDAELAPFLSSPHLSGLRSIDIRGHWARPWSPMSESVRILATRPQYASLEWLKIEHASVGSSATIALATSTSLRGLTALGLSECDLGSEGLRALPSSPVLGRVTKLDLGGSTRTAADGEALAESLGVSKYLGQLGSLVLDHTAFTDRAMALFTKGAWPALSDLEISPNRITMPTGLPTMTASGLETLIATDWARNLESLDLGGQPIGDVGIEILARENRLGRLKILSLARTGCTAASMPALTAAYSRQLERLYLAYCAIGDDGAAVLAGAAWPSMVPGRSGSRARRQTWDRGLYLLACGITDAGFEALIRSTTIPDDIPNLYFGETPPSPEVEERLKARYPKTKIR